MEINLDRASEAIIDEISYEVVDWLKNDPTLPYTLMEDEVVAISASVGRYIFFKKAREAFANLSTSDGNPF